MALSGISNSELLQYLSKLGIDTSSVSTQSEQSSEAINLVSDEESASSYEDIESEYAKAAATISKDDEETTSTSSTSSTSNTSSTSSTSSTSGTSSTSQSSEEIQEEIDALEEEKEANIEEMEEIEAEIQDLADAAEENIMNAAKAQKSEVAEHEEETQEAVDKNIQEYIAANKEGGEGMTREELQANIEGSLEDVPEIAAAVSALVEANEQINEIDSLLGDLNELILDTQDIESQIEVKEEEYEAAVEAEQSCCEPQGFQDSEGNQYDFFIDKDGNGELSNENEFLGAEGGSEGQEAAWSEMTDLDTNQDGIVNAEELSAGGVMVYKTDANGNQQALTIEEAFGEDSDLAISTTQHSEAVSNAGPNNFSSGTGSENNELWGTFDVTLNGETLTGYQTNDDTDWLKENYDFSDYSSSEASTELDPSEFSEDLQSHVNFFNTYTEISANLKTELEEAWGNLGLTEESFAELNATAKDEAAEKAQAFLDSLSTEDNEVSEAAAASANIAADDGSTDSTTTDTTSTTLAATEEEEIELAAA